LIQILYEQIHNGKSLKYHSGFISHSEPLIFWHW